MDRQNNYTSFIEYYAKDNESDRNFLSQSVSGWNSATFRLRVNHYRTSLIDWEDSHLIQLSQYGLRCHEQQNNIDTPSRGFVGRFIEGLSHLFSVPDIPKNSLHYKTLAAMEILEERNGRDFVARKVFD